MQYTIVGDPHLSKKNIIIMRELCGTIERLQNNVIWLGDMLNNKSIVQSKCLNFWVKYFRTSTLEHVVLVGNHDKHENRSYEHSLEPLKDLSNVIIVDGVTNIFQKNLFCLPYIHDLKEMRANLEELPLDSVLFCHTDLHGFDYGNGITNNGNLKLNDFKKFKKVISGHYHSQQHKKNLTYLGTPFSHSFGESDQEKYIGVYDDVTNEMDLIKTNLPQHRTIEVDCDSTKELSYTLIPKDIYRFILKGSVENIKNFPKKQVREAHDTHIAFLERSTERETLLSNVKETDSPEVQFSVWANEVEGFLEETINLGLEILESQRDK